MSLAAFVTRRRVLILKSKTKKGAISELIRAICKDVPDRRKDEILAAVLDRENLFSTRIAPGIAIPHAQIPGMQDSVIAVGKSIPGISYNASTDGNVHLIFLIVGGESTHLKALAAVAALLQDRQTTASLLAATDKNALLELLTQAAGLEAPDSQSSPLAFVLTQQAVLLAREIQAAAVIIHHPTSDMRRAFPDGPDAPHILYAAAGDLPDATHLPLPFRGLTRSGQIDLSILVALSRGMVQKGQTIVSVFGLSDDGQPDTIVVTNVDKDFNLFFASAPGATNHESDQQTFMRALQLAIELAEEGREGKPVGALFVVGDHQQVANHCHQMVINPFKGYEDHEKNILDPGLAETIKEFAHIDGAFIVRSDGVVLSAGTYLRSDHPSQLPSGLGARHAAAASITAITAATAICISESTRTVSLFRGGKRIMVV